MSSSPWLLFDVPNLAHRAFHTTGDMPHGVLFGVFRELLALQRRFQTDKVAWCFDLGRSKRKDLFPGYKLRLHSSDPADVRNRKAMDEQVRELRTAILPGLGYKNVFAADGFEADDCLAAAVNTNNKNYQEFVTVSSDTDLYQLLQHGRINCDHLLATCVRQYKPVTKKVYDAGSFEKEWNLDPSRWAEVKAIAGCDSDTIPGVKGVGEKTAAKFLAGLLPKHHKSYRAIIEGAAIKQHNLPLVKLPFAGTPACRLADDRPDPKAFRALFKRLGFQSLTGAF